MLFRLLSLLALGVTMLTFQGCAPSPDMQFWRGTDAKNVTVIQENIQLLKAALASYKLHEPLLAETPPDFLMPYVNYDKIEPVSRFDDLGREGKVADCYAQEIICYRLHNRSVIFFPKKMRIGGTGPTNAWLINIDPDGVESTVAGNSEDNAEGQAVQLVLYSDGRIVSRGNALPGTKTSMGPVSADPQLDPTWFSLK